MLSPGLFNPTLEDPPVRVESAPDRTQFKISWPSQIGSTGYRVYAGFDPLHIRSLISGQDLIPAADTAFVFNAPFFPPGQIVYYWVAYESPGGLKFIDEVGSHVLRTFQATKFSDDSDRFSDTTLDILDPGDDKYFMEEIRRRAKAVLESTSEEVDLFIKQWRGLPDPTVQGEQGLDPNYQPMTRDDRTFGSGFFPGYFPAIRIRMRFGALPVALLDFQLPGLRPLLKNEAWTIWEPIIHESDLLVRLSTGQRYVVESPAYSNWRGVPIAQRLSLEIITPTSPLQKVTDALVRERWGQVNAAGFLRAGFGIAANTDSGGPDYLLFGSG